MSVDFDNSGLEIVPYLNEVQLSGANITRANRWVLRVRANKRVLHVWDDTAFGSLNPGDLLEWGGNSFKVADSGKFVRQFKGLSSKDDLTTLPATIGDQATVLTGNRKDPVHRYELMGDDLDDDTYATPAENLANWQRIVALDADGEIKGPILNREVISDDTEDIAKSGEIVAVVDAANEPTTDYRLGDGVTPTLDLPRIATTGKNGWKVYTITEFDSGSTINFPGGQLVDGDKVAIILSADLAPSSDFTLELPFQGIMDATKGFGDAELLIINFTPQKAWLKYLAYTNVFAVPTGTYYWITDGGGVSVEGWEKWIRLKIERRPGEFAGSEGFGHGIDLVTLWAKSSGDFGIDAGV